MQLHDVKVLPKEEVQKSLKNPYQNDKGSFKEKEVTTNSNT